MTIHPEKKVTYIRSFPKIVCHKLLASLTRRPYCVVGVSSPQYCKNCVRLGGVGSGLAIGKVDSWCMFYVLVQLI